MTDVSLSTGMLSLFYLRRVHHSTFLYTAIRTTSSEVAAPGNDSMADDSDPFAMTLVDSINASNTDTLPQTDSDMDVSQDDSGNDLNPGRQSKETAKSSRIRKNLAISKSRRDLHRGRRVPPRPRTPSPSPSSSSSDSDSDGSATQHGNDTASPPRNPDTPAKHHRSSSPKLGSMENPIDVDSIASLFEPMVIKEYVRLSFFSHLLCLF